MTVEHYATARDLFEAARTAAQELERTTTQRDMLAGRRGYRSPGFSHSGTAHRHDVNATSDALLDYESLMRDRVEADMELLDCAAGVIYGRRGSGGVASLLGGVYADVLCWRYLMACTWKVTAAACHIDERTAKRYAHLAMSVADECGLVG